MRGGDRPAARLTPARGIAVSIASLLVTCLAVEVALRLCAAAANTEILERALARLEEPTAENAQLGNLIRLSADDRLIYELQPELDRRWYRGARVSTDERGFRLTGRRAPHPAGGPTLVGLGDSIQFGDGVEDHETYLAVLRRLLEERHPDRAWRVVNTAVPGYNTVMEVATLRTKALDLEPDLVILNVVSNDFAPPKYVRDEVDPLTLRRSFLVELVASRWRAGGAVAQGGPIRPGKEWWELDAHGQPSVPERYRHVFGREAFERALDELADMAREHDFEVLVFSTYDSQRVALMLELARARGFACVTMMDELEAWLRAELGQEFTPKAYSRSPLVVAVDNAHPSALQHEMAGRRLLRELEERGLLERLLARDRGGGGADAASRPRLSAEPRSR